MILKPRHLAPVVALGLSLAAGCASTAQESAPTGTTESAETADPPEPSLAQTPTPPEAGDIGKAAFEKFCSGLADLNTELGVASTRVQFTSTREAFLSTEGTICSSTAGDLPAPGAKVLWDTSGDSSGLDAYRNYPNLGLVAGIPAVGQGPSLVLLDRDHGILVNANIGTGSITITPGLEASLRKVIESAQAAAPEATDPLLPNRLAQQAGLPACGVFTGDDLARDLGPGQAGEELPTFSWSQTGLAGSPERGADVAKCTYEYMAANGVRATVATQASNEPDTHTESIALADDSFMLGSATVHVVSAKSEQHTTEMFVSEPNRWRYVNARGSRESLTPLMEKFLDQ